jgi:hypothetical protein
MYGDDLPFTGIGSGILTITALGVTAVGAVLAAAAAPIAAGLGAIAGAATKLTYKGRH